MAVNAEEGKEKERGSVHPFPHRFYERGNSGDGGGNYETPCNGMRETAVILEIGEGACESEREVVNIRNKRGDNKDYSCGSAESLIKSCS